VFVNGATDLKAVHSSTNYVACFVDGQQGHKAAGNAERKEEKVMPENQASGRTRSKNLAGVLRYADSVCKWLDAKLKQRRARERMMKIRKQVLAR
jgi:hypothetical protein